MSSSCGDETCFEKKINNLVPLFIHSSVQPPTQNNTVRSSRFVTQDLTNLELIDEQKKRR